MTPLLKSVYASEGGSDVLDSLMKYLYAGMAAPTQRQGESSGAAMSVLLSWHEKVVEVAGLGALYMLGTEDDESSRGDYETEMGAGSLWSRNRW
ncbi:hypothetical protein V495_03022 [Pseudogymnoascus sp. VKM F-4514 (FW-929)]|nr:hypothetical protein V495_03022 [Pseudogymnoascus sp. VKM F-4514 (FW-929)]KFY59322.1 hypothetical protein V497_04390 [Pseudogymnoascus sp. VKM F-4516 (FW-969)]